MYLRTYECRICPIEDLIAALPDGVTEDNAETVREQLEEILSLYTELNEDEQEQIDISRCLELQRELDEANVPDLVEEIITTKLDFTNVGNEDGQTHAEGPGYRWTGDAESGYLLELENFKMELPENTNTTGNGQTAITLPNKGQTTILVKGENSIKAPCWNAIWAKVANNSSDKDSILIEGEGESPTLIIENAHSAIRATCALEIQNMKLCILAEEEPTSSGICSYYGDINLKNVDIQMKIKSGDIGCINNMDHGNVIIQNSKIQLKSNEWMAIYVKNGNLTVENSDLDLFSSYMAGIYIQTSGRSNVFSGETTVSINCTSSYGIYSQGNLIVEAPARLTATGTSVAFAVFEGIVLNGTAVTSPTDGIITSPGGGSNIHTVRVENAASTSVEIKPVELTVSLDNAESKYSYGSSAQATITADASITATVSVYDGEKLLGTANLGEAIPIDTDDLGIGSHTLTAKLQENKGNISKEFTLIVTKVVPTVTGPTASSLRYGQKLSESALSGGAATDSGTGESVEGTWAWKDGNVLPTVENNGYIAVFTPADTDKYDTVETTVALTVKKAQNAPNMPGITMNVPNSIEKLSDITLPEGWEWQESDQDIRLEAGKAVSVVAVYTGADKGNYETETITVTITRSLCDHEAGDILYTGEGEKEPTCTENGLGHRECIKCGSVMESGIVKEALGHDYISRVTKKSTRDSEGIRTYTCSRCGDSYTRTIAKLPGDTKPGHTSGTGSTEKPGTGTEAGNGTTQENSLVAQPAQNADTEDYQHPEVWFLQILLACGGIMIILKRSNMN